MPEMRLFIAVPINEKLKKKILDFQNKIQDRIDNFKWSNLHTFHLTLKFLGEVDINDVTKICSRTAEIARDIRPINLELKSVGYFGSHNSPRVVWLGINGDVKVLTETADIFNDSMQDFGIVPEGKKYHPHLTLGRAKRSVNAEQIHKVVEEYQGAVIGNFVADKIVVFQSELRSEGAKHHPIKTISLN